MKKFLLTLIVAFAFCGSTFAQYESHWPDFNPYAFPSNTGFVLYAQIDGVFVGTDNYQQMEIAAFVGDECRGHDVLVDETDMGDEYPALQIQIYYENPGEEISFKMYDHQARIEYDICTCINITTHEPIIVHTGENHDEVWMEPENAIVLSFTTPEMDYPPYPWIPSTAYSGEGMTVVAQIQINGQPVDRDSYEVGAFCGFECRSSSYYPDDDALIDMGEYGYFAFLTVVGENGDDINFYLYDHESDEVFEGVCNTTIVMENGGEIGIDFENDLFVLNFVTMDSFIKHVEGYNESNGGYVLIATPIDGMAPADVTNMITEEASEYDLYVFDQNPSDGDEWRNFKAGEFSTLESGKGYLYARKETADLVFMGSPYEGNGTFPLEFVAGSAFEGMNLVGNPYTVDAYVGVPFYTLNAAGEFVTNAASVAIPAMEGVFVVADGEGQTVNFTTEGGKKVSHLALNLVNSSKLVDRAIVNFDETQQLPKFQLNANSTKLYFPMSDKDYAVVSGQEMGELPLNFKAEKSGSYTLAINSEEVSFGYLHLIDNLTGSDTDLLANPSYSFEASTADYASRFKLVFATGNNDNDDNFAYYSNGTWVINNDGKANVQVVDVTGRILSNEQIEGCYSLNFNAAPGVYMIRLVNGDNVKVQKVVVK